MLGNAWTSRLFFCKNRLSKNFVIFDKNVWLLLGIFPSWHSILKFTFFGNTFLLLLKITFYNAVIFTLYIYVHIYIYFYLFSDNLSNAPMQPSRANAHSVLNNDYHNNTTAEISATPKTSPKVTGIWNVP